MAKPLDFDVLGAGIGAVVSGIDLATELEDLFPPLEAAIHAHLVLVVPGQRLTDHGLLEVGRAFGEVELVPFYDAKPYYPDVPDELQVITNVGPRGERVGGLANNEAAWHSDMSYADEPPSYSLLYAHEVPAEGGVTSFVDMYHALASLPHDLRAKAETMVLEHDGRLNTAGTVRAGAAGAGLCARHPVVRLHPDTGRAALYLGRRLGAAPVEGDGGMAVLEQLWSHVEGPGQRVYHHHWSPGDLVVWDNRCTMHRRDEFDPDARRVLRRLQTRGERPRPARPTSSATLS